MPCNEINSAKESESFWADIAKKLIWFKEWDKLKDLSDAPITKWYAGGELNLCYNSVDRHVHDGFGDKVAVQFYSLVTRTMRKYTYKDIYDKVNRLASVLESFGVEKGDRVLIYMPMVVEGIFSMLACCKIGAVHCAMPSGLPARDLALRIDHCQPNVVLSASHGYHERGWLNYKEILDEAIVKSTHKPLKTLILKRQESVTLLDGRDYDWDYTVDGACPKENCEPVEATEPAFAIYTSGSTGKPKAILHSVGGFAARMVCDKPYFFGDDETILITSNYGWIAQHVFIYMPLLTRLRTLIFEGDCLLTSDVHSLYRLISENSVTRLFIRPGVLKIIKSMDPEGEVASRYDFSKIRHAYVTGELIDSSTLQWAARIFKSSVLSGYGQTELSTFLTGVSSSIAKNKIEISVASKTFPGYDVVVMRPNNIPAKTNETGRILIRVPLPPGAMISLLGDHKKCKSDYFEEFPGFFDTKDNGRFDEEGRLLVESRTDDIMKHASIYLAAQAVEEVVISHPDVVECVVIPVPNLILKEVPVTLFVKSKYSTKSGSQISSEILEKVSNHFGEAVTFGKVIAVKELPRTTTGKIHRRSVVALGKGMQIQPTWSVENAEVLKEISEELQKNGYNAL